AWRNIWRNKRRTLITISSIMFAVVSALFIESMERGSHNQMIDNMTSFHTGHIQIQDYRYDDEPSLDNSFVYDESLINRIQQSGDRIANIVPRIETFMLAAGEDQTRPSMVLGIELESENRLNNLENRLIEGKFFLPGDGSVVMGEGLAERLNLATGDSLVLLGQGRFSMTASGIYRISGLLKHPIREFNNQIVYISIPDAQWLLSTENRITNILITPDELKVNDLIADNLRSEFSDDELRILTWEEMIPDLIKALEFDRLSTRVFMGILYVVIGFGIFGTILTMTLERLREFGILLSVGMFRMKLAFVVFIETFFISILGIVTGFGLGLSILTYFYYNPIVLTGEMVDLMEEMGLEAILPVAIAPDIFIWQGSIIFILTTLICLYPSIKIARMDILKAKT
ncbi:MAG: FtsX-like permease family protein, partial [Balneolaceae bacterium]